PLSMQDIAGRVVGGRYRLRGVVARGGVGEVHEAEDMQTGATVAVKMLLPGLDDAPRTAERFRREARITSALAHPNIVEVRDFVSEQDSLYLVMELVRGRSVADLVESGELAARGALVIARQVLEALAHAHACGLIHRDIKPDNIMLVAAGEPGREH